MDARLYVGDALAVLEKLPDSTFDACLTDPPYGLSFMGKSWDHGVPSAEVWKEVLRVLKPGAMLLSFGGTRTFHRLTVNIEDAGFEIRDCLVWLYGKGFPKSMDVSRAIDDRLGVTREVVGYKKSGIRNKERDEGEGVRRGEPGGRHTVGASRGAPSPVTAPESDEAKRFAGYGTTLKPAWEPVVVAMKELDGGFASNALRHGVAGLNIDETRIKPRGKGDYNHPGNENKTERSRKWQGVTTTHQVKPNPGGRFPSNVLLDAYASDLLDWEVGHLGFSSGVAQGDLSDKPEDAQKAGYLDAGGPSRFFYVAKPSTEEKSAGLEGRVVKKRDESREAGQKAMGEDGEGNPFNRGALEVLNFHPTVKPIELDGYLAKLVVPPKREGSPRRLLVPFCGSGSEIIGAARAGWEEAVGIDIERDYVELARDRILGDAPLFNSVEIVEENPDGSN